MNEDRDKESNPEPTDRKIEDPAWKEINGIWRPLHGSFFSKGLSIEWHDFHLDTDLDWSASFHPGSIEVCLNFSGQAEFQLSRSKRVLENEQVALYSDIDSALKARRKAGSMHRFITLEMSPDYLREQFVEVTEGLKPEIRHFLDAKSKKTFIEVLAMPVGLFNLRLQLIEPPVVPVARATWYQGKVLDVLAQVLFREETPVEHFFQKNKRVNQDRVNRAVYLLERDLENPPSLEMLAAEVGCSAFHLSRLFSQKMGASIPKFIRTKRIERAAEFLRTGKMNVTEAAMAVGYSSLSAFNKAFVEQIGCCPGLYPFLKENKPQRR